MLQPVPDMVLTQWRESKPGASRLQSRDNLADVVTYEAEASIPGVFLNHCVDAWMSRSQLLNCWGNFGNLTSPQCELRIFCHCITFIQNHQLEFCATKKGVFE